MRIINCMAESPELIQASPVIIKELRFTEGSAVPNKDFAIPNVETHIDPTIRRQFPEHTFSTIPSSRYILTPEARRMLTTRMFPSGGSSFVLKGFDETMQQDVAYKIMLPGQTRNEKNAEVLHQEARYLARLPNHPGFPKVFDLLVMQINGHEYPAIAEEYLERLPDQLSIDEVIALGEQIGAALDVLHKVGVHYDVKDKNILRRKNGEFVLTDFGSAYLKDRRFNFNPIGGTYLYSDPAQVNHPDLEEHERGQIKNLEQTDQYGLAMSMFKYLTGMAPTHMRRNFLEVPPDSDFPVALLQVFRKALDWDRTKRYPTCTEFVTELNRELRVIQEQGEESTLLTLNKLRSLTTIFGYTLLNTSQ